MTRDNNARIRTETDRQVVNRAVWQVTERHPNGALTVVSERWGDRVFLPPSYVAEHVELAYATTIAGVQGLTVDGGRALYDERTSRSELYVAMTRGRHFNIGYGVLDAVSDTDERQAARSAAGLFARAVGNDSRESSAMEAFADELALSDSTVRLDAIRDDWTMVLTHHLRGDQRIVAGDVVRAHDRDNIGTVRHVDHDRDVALVHFVSPTGAQADVRAPGRPARGHHPARPAVDGHDRRAARQRRATTRGPARLVDYLDRIDTVRAERAEGLAAAAAGQPWTQLVASEHLPDVAYYRDRWGIDDELAPLGPEPASQRSAQHRQWEHLSARIGPTGTLAHLAALRARTTDPATLTALDTAMTRRRDVVAAVAERAEQPPQWAHSLLARSTWTGQPGRSQREREVIAKVAVYRDRFDVQGDGLGAEPAGRDEQRIWRGLRDRLVALQRNDDRDEDRHLEAERDIGLER